MFESKRNHSSSDHCGLGGMYEEGCIKNSTTTKSKYATATREKAEVYLSESSLRKKQNGVMTSMEMVIQVSLFLQMDSTGVSGQYPWTIWGICG